ncbi:MAG TPA: sigma-70 family RNA polymerase sigma factor, partial [Prolixibacteraceae bacterium]|nr:sigma-70 family RNA polymerase sigma factor [Prolixibacteraceae bacterium]
MQPHPHDEAADLTFREWLEGNSSGSVSAELELLQSLFFYFRNRYKSLIMPFCLTAEKYIGSEGLLDPGHYAEEEDAIPPDELFSPMAAEEEVAMHRLPEMDYSIQYSIEPKVDEVIGLVTLDQVAFNEVYEREFPRIARLVLSHGGTLETACDIFQDAMVILLEKIRHGKLTLTSSIGTYLYSVCRHILGDQFRRNNRDRKMKAWYTDEYRDDLFFPWEKPDHYARVAEVMDRLGDPCKTLLEWFYYRQKDWEFIAS